MNLADGLDLDVDYIAGRSLGLLGKRGAGKSATCRVIAEELNAAHVHTVIIDPMGVFWGLRSSAAGTGEGLPIPVFGGSHGDAPLEPSAGTLMADLAVDEGLSMVLDLSGFTSRTQERTFVAAFLDRIYRRNRHLLHLIIDEADLFAPQKPRRDDLQLLVAMENIVRRGRNTGLGTTLASQRPAVLNKDVLSQVDILAAMRVTAPNDRAAIADWVRGQGDDERWATVSATLPTLAVGEGWWWAPERAILMRVQVRRAHTFDCSPTRDRGNSVAREPKTRADVDLRQIAERIEATRERVAAADPRALTARIAELERELAQLRAGAAVEVPEPSIVHVQVPYVPAAVVAAAGGLVDAIASVREGLGRAAEAAQDLMAAVAEVPDLPDPPPAPTTAQAAPAVPFERPAAGPPPTLVHAPAGGLAPALQRILNALAELAGIGLTAPTREQLAMWVKVGIKSSGYANNLGKLRSAGLIDYPAGGQVALTDVGIAVAAVPALAPTTAQLHERIREMVPPARWKLLEQLIAMYPSAVSRGELAERAGVASASSGYANNLGALRTLGLIDYPSPGQVAVTEVLFLNGQSVSVKR